MSWFYKASIVFEWHVTTPENQRVHWAVKSKRVKREREWMNLKWRENGRPRPPLPCKITFTRVAPRFLDEGDNLASAFKAFRDELCECIGINDSPSAPVEFKYTQRYPERKEAKYKVEIEITGGVAHED